MGPRRTFHSAEELEIDLPVNVRGGNDICATNGAIVSAFHVVGLSDPSQIFGQ